MECLCCLAIVETEGSELCNRCIGQGCSFEEDQC